MAVLKWIWADLVLFAQTLWARATAIFLWLRRKGPAPWAGAGGRGAKRYSPKQLAGIATVVATLAAMAIGYWVYKNRPHPHYVEYSVTAPALTAYDENGNPRVNPLRIDFNESTAPLQMVDKRITQGIELSPAIAGVWVWTSDRQLTFTPKDDWPVDAPFRVRMDRKGFLDREVNLEEYSFKFGTASFNATIVESQFYQDPRDPNMKKFVATVSFTHPVDPGGLEQRISFVLPSEANYLGLKPDSRNFTLIYDKLKLAAHIHSAALAMPRDDTSMTLRVEKGLRAARGGNETAALLESTITVPGRSSLKFSGARMTIVDNARYEPEQVLLLQSSSPVAEKALTGKISAYLLPAINPKYPKVQRYPWNNPDDVGSEILAKSDPLKLTYVPAEEGTNTTHGLRFSAPVGRHVFVTVKEGIEGIGGYLLAKPYTATFNVVPFPKALTFLGQGSLLSLSGDKKVGFLARDIGKVSIEIGRLMPNQLQHIAPTMWDFAHPNAGEGLENQTVERFTLVRDFTGKPQGKPAYDSIDLSTYLQDKAANKRGLFLLRLEEAREKENDRGEPQEYGDEYEGRYYRQDGSGPLDQRLILITDLGIISKLSKDGTRDVFVQSLRTGEPVAGTRVDILGRNGLPVQSGATDATGRVQFPKLPELRREKAPLMILAEKGDDFSFMPFRTRGRDLDVSRFDTGGIENAETKGQLTSYIFSDRGIYRPGETTHLGIVTRTADWASSLDGLPLEITITDPRGTVVNTQTISLAAAAFDEVTFTTAPAAPTGTYQASAYLVKDPKRPELIGSSSFKVQEFEPDRMKVTLTLSDRPADAWLTTDDVKARLEVAHLFGEAASGRRVESEMSLTPALPQFSRYPDFRFQIGETLKEPYRETLAALTTDDKGVAELKLDLGRFVGRAYRLNVLARAFEAEGGRNVAAQNGAIVSDAPYLVGVKPDGALNFVKRGTARTARWMAVNRQLTAVAAPGLTLEWVQRKYVSVLTEQPNHTYQYVSKLTETVRNSRTVSIAVGGSDLPLLVDEPGDFVLILRNEKGAELNRLSYSVAGQANISRSLERNAELQVELDRAVYSGGDTIEISIRAPYVGAGLIAIERERVFRYQWFKTSTTSTVQRITLPRDFEGNGYISVQFLRDPASDELFVSPLSYGVAPFAVNLSERTQNLTLTAPREVKPGTTISLRVAPGEASRVAVLAVDEGILQVARYKNPDPLSYFFQKRMLEVGTTQILDLLLPDFKRFLALAAPGGDADGGFARHLNPFNKKRKPAVAYWSGLVDVGPAGREFRYTVPDYFNGKLRIVAIAVSPKRIGVKEANTEVKGDFILTPNVPALAAPGDEFIVSVGVFNNTTGGKGPIQVEAKSAAGLTIQGAARVDLEIADKREGVAEFRFKAATPLGPAAITVIAKRGTSESRIEESISVRPATTYRTLLTAGRTESLKTAVPLTRDLYSERRKVEAAISVAPLVWGHGLTAYLDDYPYSCTEQLVSKGVAGMLIVSRPEFGSVQSREPAAVALASLFSALQARQNGDGGLGLWTSSPTTAEFPTVYALHFLLEARDRNQKIPTAMIAPLNTWATRFASTPAPTLADARMRAYAVYLLTRQGIRAPAALANVEQELTHRYTNTWQSDLAAAYLAATYRLMQRNADADKLIQAVPWAQKKTDWGEDYYYGDLVHDTQLLYVVARHFPNRLTSVPPTAIEGIAKNIGGGGVNSLSAAYTLLAIDAYASSAGAMKLGAVELGKDGKERPLTLSAGLIPKTAVPETAAKIQFTKDAAIAAYYLINESGFDRNLPKAEIAEGIQVVHETLDLKGSPITRVNVGDEFLIRVRVRATTRERVAQIAIVDLLPGGVEVVIETQAQANSSQGYDPAAARGQSAGVSVLPVGLPGMSNWTPQHLDVRDDRVVLYGDVTRDAAQFVYRVRATNAGTFVTPPAFAEGMYDRKIAGVGLPGKLEIVKK